MTIQTVEKDKTLLVDGPARVCLLSGRISILGACVEPGTEVIVRKGKRLPLGGQLKSEVELTLGNGSSYVESDGSSIPSSWRDTVETILAASGRKAVLVIGGVDSGKTSFCTYLANSALGKGLKTVMIDGDLGQSDIGPPGTVSLTIVNKPVIDLFRLQSEDLVFVGITSPSSNVKEVVEALIDLSATATQRGADLLVINTDGWVEGEAAASYKVRLARAVAPDAVVAIQSCSELAPILDELKEMKVYVVDSPESIKRRDREIRKSLRESAYKKHLKGAKVRSFPLSWVYVKGGLISDKSKSALESEIETTTGDEGTEKIELELREREIGLREGEEEGIVVALGNPDGKVLGIGTIDRIDFRRNVVRICTPVEELVSHIQIGRIRLDREGNEVGLLPEGS